MKILLIILISVSLFWACRKDPEIIEPTFPPEVNLVNTVGSWWKYEWYKVDSLGQSTPHGLTDSVYVVGDSIINGNTYIHISGTNFGYSFNKFWRDSLTYIVSSNGKILCSYDHFGDTTSVYTSWPYTTYTIDQKPVNPITVAAGTFDVFDHQLHYYNNDGTPFTVCDTSWINHTYYADGVGVVVSQMAQINLLHYQCSYYEQRLVEYYIAP